MPDVEPEVMINHWNLLPPGRTIEDLKLHNGANDAWWLMKIFMRQCAELARCDYKQIAPYNFFEGSVFIGIDYEWMGSPSGITNPMNITDVGIVVLDTRNLSQTRMCDWIESRATCISFVCEDFYQKPSFCWRGHQCKSNVDSDCLHVNKQWEADPGPKDCYPGFFALVPNLSTMIGAGLTERTISGIHLRKSKLMHSAGKTTSKTV